VFRSGIPYARFVPLLYRTVLKVDQTSAIAYQFADDTNVAEKVIINEKEALKHCGELNSLFEEFYSEKKFIDQDTIRNITSRWFNTKNIFSILDNFSEFTITNRLKSLLEGREDLTLDKIIKYHKCWIHGDMHLGNILFGERTILIDFALANSGAIVLDLAKLVSSLLLKVPELRSVIFPDLENKKEKIFQIINRIYNIQDLTNGDLELYNLLLRFYLLISLIYDGVEEDAKEWVKQILNK
jgi:thiamine kinase-like enzyme